MNLAFHPVQQADPEAPVIETELLSKRYGDKLALDQLSLSLAAGCVHAIVGANGAGKSTLFRILLGFMPASAGHARIVGRDCSELRPEDRRRIGFVNEEHTLPGWMRVDAVTRMQRKLYPDWDQQTFLRVVGLFNVMPNQRVANLSRGERAGFSLALALAQAPELLVLDEPTLGLDVVAKRAFLEALLNHQTERPRTVVYCSHQMEEVERVADNLVILECGRLVHQSAPDDFCERVDLWIADMGFRGPDEAEIPGLLHAQRIEHLYHYVVLDQDESFAGFLEAHGARSLRRAPVSLDRAVNAVLNRHHARPATAGEI
jgi:ABC-2 type transport system ATP-binding protein